MIGHACVLRAQRGDEAERAVLADDPVDHVAVVAPQLGTGQQRAAFIERSGFVAALVEVLADGVGEVAVVVEHGDQLARDLRRPRLDAIDAVGHALDRLAGAHRGPAADVLTATTEPRRRVLDRLAEPQLAGQVRTCRSTGFPAPAAATRPARWQRPARSSRRTGRRRARAPRASTARRRSGADAPANTRARSLRPAMPTAGTWAARGAPSVPERSERPGKRRRAVPGGGWLMIDRSCIKRKSPVRIFPIQDDLSCHGSLCSRTLNRKACVKCKSPHDHRAPSRHERRPSNRWRRGGQESRRGAATVRSATGFVR